MDKVEVPKKKLAKKVSFAEEVVFHGSDSEDTDEYSEQSYQIDCDPIDQESTDTCDSDSDEILDYTDRHLDGYPSTSAYDDTAIDEEDEISSDMEDSETNNNPLEGETGAVSEVIPVHIDNDNATSINETSESIADSDVTNKNNNDNGNSEMKSDFDAQGVPQNNECSGMSESVSDLETSYEAPRDEVSAMDISFIAESQESEPKDYLVNEPDPKPDSEECVTGMSLIPAEESNSAREGRQEDEGVANVAKDAGIGEGEPLLSTELVSSQNLTLFESNGEHAHLEANAVIATEKPEELRDSLDETEDEMNDSLDGGNVACDSPDEGVEVNDSLDEEETVHKIDEPEVLHDSLDEAETIHDVVDEDEMVHDSLDEGGSICDSLEEADGYESNDFKEVVGAQAPVVSDPGAVVILPALELAPSHEELVNQSDEHEIDHSSNNVHSSAAEVADTNLDQPATSSLDETPGVSTTVDIETNGPVEDNFDDEVIIAEQPEEQQENLPVVETLENGHTLEFEESDTTVVSNTLEHESHTEITETNTVVSCETRQVVLVEADTESGTNLPSEEQSDTSDTAPMEIDQSEERMVEENINDRSGEIDAVDIIGEVSTAPVGNISEINDSNACDVSMEPKDNPLAGTNDTNTNPDEAIEEDPLARLREESIKELSFKTDLQDSLPDENESIEREMHQLEAHETETNKLVVNNEENDISVMQDTALESNVPGEPSSPVEPDTPHVTESGIAEDAVSFETETQISHGKSDEQINEGENVDEVKSDLQEESQEGMLEVNQVLEPVAGIESQEFIDNELKTVDTVTPIEMHGVDTTGSKTTTIEHGSIVEIEGVKEEISLQDEQQNDICSVVETGADHEPEETSVPEPASSDEIRFVGLEAEVANEEFQVVDDTETDAVSVNTETILEPAGELGIVGDHELNSSDIVVSGFEVNATAGEVNEDGTKGAEELGTLVTGNTSGTSADSLVSTVTSDNAVVYGTDGTTADELGDIVDSEESPGDSDSEPVTDKHVDTSESLNVDPPHFIDTAEVPDANLVSDGDRDNANEAIMDEEEDSNSKDDKLSELDKMDDIEYATNNSAENMPGGSLDERPIDLSIQDTIESDQIALVDNAMTDELGSNQYVETMNDFEGGTAVESTCYVQNENYTFETTTQREEGPSGVVTKEYGDSSVPAGVTAGSEQGVLDTETLESNKLDSHIVHELKETDEISGDTEMDNTVIKTHTRSEIKSIHEERTFTKDYRDRRDNMGKTDLSDIIVSVGIDPYTEPLVRDHIVETHSKSIVDTKVDTPEGNDDVSAGTSSVNGEYVAKSGSHIDKQNEVSAVGTEEVIITTRATAVESTAPALLTCSEIGGLESENVLIEDQSSQALPETPILNQNERKMSPTNEKEIPSGDTKIWHGNPENGPCHSVCSREQKEPILIESVDLDNETGHEEPSDGEDLLAEIGTGTASSTHRFKDTSALLFAQASNDYEFTVCATKIPGEIVSDDKGLEPQTPDIFKDEGLFASVTQPQAKDKVLTNTPGSPTIIQPDIKVNDVDVESSDKTNGHSIMKLPIKITSSEDDKSFGNDTGNTFDASPLSELEEEDLQLLAEASSRQSFVESCKEIAEAEDIPWLAAGKLSAVQGGDLNAESNLTPSPSVDFSESVGLEYFTGGSSWSEYFQHFETFCKKKKWSKPVKASYLFAHLRGRAKQVAMKLPTEDQREFDHLVSTLGRFFTARDEAELYLFELRNRGRKPKESLRDLGADVRRLADLAYPEIPEYQRTRLARIHFLDALKNSDMLRHIYSGRPDTLDQAIQLGVEFEGMKRVDATELIKVKVPKPEVVKPREKTVQELIAEGDKSAMQKRLEELAKSIGEIKSTLGNQRSAAARDIS